MGEYYAGDSNLGPPLHELELKERDERKVDRSLVKDLQRRINHLEREVDALKGAAYDSPEEDPDDWIPVIESFLNGNLSSLLMNAQWGLTTRVALAWDMSRVAGTSGDSIELLICRRPSPKPAAPPSTIMRPKFNP